MSFVPAFRGELGLKLRYHVPGVYAMGSGHVIEIEPGDEALYPLAAEWRYVDRACDDSRRARPPAYVREERFVPEPHVSSGIEADVVICPRRRRYGAEKNWPFWNDLVDLPGVFAAGAPDSSYEVPCPRAWDYERFLDASIEGVRSARLVVATDAGLAHLAVLCGTPLLLITHNGLVAPGPVRDASGRVMQPTYWPVRLDEYYHAANHTGSPIHMTDAWQSRELVLRRINELLDA